MGQEINRLNNKLNNKEQELKQKGLLIDSHVKYNTVLKNGLCWRFIYFIRSIAQYIWRIRMPGELREQFKLIKKSGLFDQKWYLSSYPDVAVTGINPVEHYLRYGASEGRNPSESFNTIFYLNKYSDVAESGINPLIHYIRHGRSEQRRTVNN